MKLLHLTLLPLLMGTIMFSQWIQVGTGGLSSGWTTYNDIATDTSGAPVVVFFQGSVPIAKCLRYNGTAWNDVGASSFPAVVMDGLRLMISDDNRYYLAFRDQTNSFTSVIRYDGSNWSYVGSAYLFSGIIGEISMAADTSGRLYIAFSTSAGMKVVRENGSSWETVTGTGMPASVGWYSIAFSPDNVLYLAYTDIGVLRANCIRLVSGAWQPVGNANFSAGYAQNNQLVFTPSGEIYIAQEDNLPCLRKYNPGSNTWDSIPGFSGYAGTEDAQSDPLGNIYYMTSRIPYGTAVCMRYSGGAWSMAGGAPVSDSTATYPRLAISPDGSIYATYNEAILGGAIVRKMSPWTGMEDIQASTKWSWRRLDSHIEITGPGDDGMRFYTITGTPLDVTFSRISENTWQTDITRLPSGMYILRDDSESRFLKIPVW